jgi:hypothetical protein
MGFVTNPSAQQAALDVFGVVMIPMLVVVLAVTLRHRSGIEVFGPPRLMGQVVLWIGVPVFGVVSIGVLFATSAERPLRVGVALGFALLSMHFARTALWGNRIAITPTFVELRYWAFKVRVSIAGAEGFEMSRRPVGRPSWVFVCLRRTNGESLWTGMSVSAADSRGKELLDAYCVQLNRALAEQREATLRPRPSVGLVPRAD